MLTPRRPAGGTRGQPKEEPKEKRSVYIVFTTATDTKTGAQTPRQILAIFEERKDAEELEEKFNQLEQTAEDVITKAFCSRYALPYLAPIAKEVLDSQEET